MAVTANSIIHPQTVKITPMNFVEGTDAAGTLKTLYTGGSNGSKISAIMLATNDQSATHVFTLYLTRSAVDYFFGSYVIPVLSGSDGIVAAIDMLRGGPSNLIPGLPIDNDGQPYLHLESGDTLRGTFATALTSTKRINTLTVGADF